ncbi:MAG TPA: phosphoribosyltransferase [Bryobacteraceae bacterium]|nr:phosphoribosyltransferase [Bryobacteraceae bacterium]
MPLFRNRSEAGRALAEQVKSAVPQPDILVLVLPRGGVPVGFEVAQALHAEMDVFLVRKLGVPGEEELALGALASGGVRVLNHELIQYLRLSEETIQQVTAREERVLEARELLYREGRPPVPIKGRTVVLVDDGLATGASMLAAARALRPSGAREVIIAVPVAPRESCDELRREADQVICIATPHPFGAVGLWYEDFAQVTDAEVCKLLEQAARKSAEERASDDA